MADKPVILTLDHNRRNLELLAGVLTRAGYTPLPVGSLEEVDCVLGVERVALALLDVAGFGQPLWERCARLHQERVPFLVLASRPSLVLEQQSRARGAWGVLAKPLGVQQLLGVVRGLLEVAQEEGV